MVRDTEVGGGRSFLIPAARAYPGVALSIWAESRLRGGGTGVPSLRPRQLTSRYRFTGQALIETPVYVDPAPVLGVELLCKSCCMALKSDWALDRLPDCKS